MSQELAQHLPYDCSEALQRLIADRTHPYSAEDIAYYRQGAGKLRLLAAEHLGRAATNNPEGSPEDWADTAQRTLRGEAHWDGETGMDGYIEGTSVATELAAGVVNNWRQGMPPTAGFEWEGTENLIVRDELGLPYSTAAAESEGM